MAYHRAILYWRQSGDLYNVWCISKHDGVTHVDIPKVNVKRITPHCKVVDIVDGECARKGEGDGPVCVGLEWLSTGGDLESENHEWAVHFSDGTIIIFNEIFSMTLWQWYSHACYRNAHLLMSGRGVHQVSPHTLFTMCFVRGCLPVKFPPSETISEEYVTTCFRCCPPINKQMAWTCLNGCSDTFKP